MIRRIAPVAVVLALLALGAWAGADEGLAPTLTTPAPASLDELEFSPDGVLFAGDSRDGMIYALEVEAGPSRAAEFTQVDDLDGKIAAMLGVSARDVRIGDLAVHPTSGEAYLSIMREGGGETTPVLMKVTAAGEIQHVPFEGMSYTQLTLTDVPDDDPTARRNPRTSTVTDMELTGDELFIAGLSNEEFASVLRRADYPFRSEARATGLEIYHGAHGRFETHAPVHTFMPIELGGEPHVLAGYLCTPLVVFSVDELTGAEKLRGKTIAELGFGNVPIDMLSIEQEGERWVVMTNTHRGTMKLREADIRDAFARDGITKPVGPREGVDYWTAPLGQVLQVDPYGDNAVLILARVAEDGSLVLAAREHRWI